MSKGDDAAGRHPPQAGVSNPCLGLPKSEGYRANRKQRGIMKVNEIAKFATYSEAVKAGKETFEKNIGFLKDQNRKINAAKGDWEIDTRSYSNGQYPSNEKLKESMSTQVDKYIKFREARDKAKEVYEDLKNVIAYCTRKTISPIDYETLTAQGYEISWSKTNTDLMNQILPLLENLLKRVDSVRKNIKESMPPAAGYLNTSLSYGYNRLGLATYKDSYNNITSKAYLDRAIAERTEELQKAASLNHPKNPPPAPNHINESSKNELLKAEPEDEVQRLCSLKEELEKLIEGTSLDKTTKNESYESKNEEENDEVSSGINFKPPPPSTTPPAKYKKNK